MTHSHNYHIGSTMGACRVHVPDMSPVQNTCGVRVQCWTRRSTQFLALVGQEGQLNF